jgi:hypothetical protein
MTTVEQGAARVTVLDTKLAREATEVDSADEARCFLPGRAFTEGIAPKPETTFGNVKADFLESSSPASSGPTWWTSSKAPPGRNRNGFVACLSSS